MKLIKNLFKQKLGIAFGLLIGVVLMGGVSRGLDQYTSAGVSYTGKDGKLTTVKDALDNLIDKSLTQIDTLEKKVSELEKQKSNVYLAEVAKQGDYVAYDAGNWNGATGQPASQGGFGGNGTGNRGNSVACRESTAPSLKGWRVLKIESGQVYLVHASQPECYYHGYNPSDSQTKLAARAQSTYLNGTYAESAHAMNKEEVEAIDSSNDLRATGTQYWLSTIFGTYNIYYVFTDGSFRSLSGDSLGFRPVVVLKSTVLTTGKGSDGLGHSNAWLITI